MDSDKDLDNDTEIDVLRGILSEIQDLNAQLARTDERSQQNTRNVENLREERIAPLEKDVTINSNRSRRNSLILGGAITALTLLSGAGLTYTISLL